MDLPAGAEYIPVTDVLPEKYPYRDEGCELARSCLNCPFPNCVYDEKRGKQIYLKKARAEKVRLLFSKESKSTAEIAKILRVSQRTIQRIIKEHKGGVRA